MKKIDVCGLNCPEPVLRVKKVLDEKETELEVLCDQAVAKENITRLCSKMNYSISVSKKDDLYTLNIKKK